MKKMVLVSITVRGVKYSAFLYTSTPNFVSQEQLHAMFPAMQTLMRGETWSFG